MPTQLAATAWTRRIWGRRSQGRSRLHDAGRVDTCTATAEMVRGAAGGTQQRERFRCGHGNPTARLVNGTELGRMASDAEAMYGVGLAVLPRDVGQPGDGQYS